MPALATKDDARKLVETLPEEFEWEQLMRLIADRIAVERGIEDIREGRVFSTEELRREFGLNR